MDWCLDLNQASSAATCDEFSWEKVETGALSHCGTLRIDCATSVRVPLQRELLHSANLGASVGSSFGGGLRGTLSIQWNTYQRLKRNSWLVAEIGVS